MTNQIWFATGVTTDEVTIAELTLTNDAIGNASYLYADDSQTDYYSTSMTIINGVVTLSNGGGLMTNIMIDESNLTVITDVNNRKHKLHIKGKLDRYSYSHLVQKEDIVSVKVGDSVTSIGDDAFFDAYNLKYILLSNNITSIGQTAFYFTSNINNIVIPDSVTTIADIAFGFSNIEKIYISRENAQLHNVEFGDNIIFFGTLTNIYPL